ncbi:ATP-grasp domain-containing protein [Vibrio ziniensis]|uniref:protein-tyrosine-phosphatase n=1 Tax=Vibrio ziniensis TaxID=2711221 RepID=A0A6G7CMN0_9VIBR|nr:ATP-grasp domain-containing protein [Vibrio ziniensis]QIH43303.1 hypothetical protein G5S32_14955 [Vibrio ziniensis]
MATESKQLSVLVLGEDTRSFLSVIRSLGQAGYQVHVVCYDRTSAALKSKYIKAAYFYNYQSCSQTEWLNNVVKLIEWYQYDLVIPCDERSIYPLWSAKDNLPPQTKLAISNSVGLDILFDKWKTKEAALACQIPVAQGKRVYLSQISYSELVKEFGERFVIKPLQSFEETNLSQRQKVLIVHSEQEYNKYRKQSYSEQVYLIEAFFAGRGEGVSVFSVNGEVHAAFAHSRVAEPTSGGGSSYRKSIELGSELLKATKDLCHYTGFTGVAMFEFRRNPDTHAWILVEVNARFWGSLPLAVFSGVDFPRLYADYLVKGLLPTSPITSYRYQNTARALIADLYEIKREFEQSREEMTNLKAISKTALRLFQVLKILSPSETVDSFHRLDIGPFIAELTILSKTFAGALLKNNKIRLRLRRIQTRHKLRKLMLADSNRRIVFVCFGNIMRSPFAEACMKSLIAEINTDIQCDSFGFHMHEQRFSPDDAVKAASELDYDIAEHRSKWLTQSDVNESDILIYFDESNHQKLRSYYRINHAFCAADLVEARLPLIPEIEDPYGKSVDEIKGCYQKISSAVNGLSDIVKEVQLCLR